MFDSLTYLQLQQYWWIIISLLGGFLVFLLFVQGGQTLIGSITKTNDERNLVINSLGRKWEFTFTTLVTFGGALFAAFPLFYATSFGGAYWVWIIILFCFIIQAVSYEFRSKPSNFLGKKTFDAFLFINGSLGVILLGMAVATFFKGSEFFVTEYNLSKWQNPLRGLEAALNIDNIALGLGIFFLARVLGALYIINNISNKEIYVRSVKQLKINTIFFLLFFLFFIIRMLLMDGFAYDSQTKIVSFESYKYLHNFIEMPVVLVIFLIGVIGVIFGIFISAYKHSRKGIWFAGIGTILTVFALLVNVGLNDTSFYPSTFNLQSSLTIENASSSKYTLKTMFYVSLFIPFVIAYIIIAWKAIDKKKIDINELNNEDHIY
ncbi:MAG: cytochrome d ubiquinol oxidase subunit II [Bacteroidetes bacterium]|nr:cytochrome d ubiquinol oxidase subunit II [Bacteroidota bacterium]